MNIINGTKVILSDFDEIIEGVIIMGCPKEVKKDHQILVVKTAGITSSGQTCRKILWRRANTVEIA